MLKKIGIIFFMITVLLLQIPAAIALSEDAAKQEWQNAKKVSQEKQQIHRDAKIEFAADKTDENKQKVVDTGKDALHAALDEAEAWLKWKDIEVEDNPDVPDDLRDEIHADVKTNLAKIDALRTEVDGISNQLELGLVSLKMIGKYFELITDVARDHGKVLVHIANVRLDTAENYESKLREEAQKMDNNDEIIAKLDLARADLDEARSNVDKAESSYNKVVLPGTPLVKFSEGNNYLRTARTNLLSALHNLNQAYGLMLRGD